MSHAKSRLMHDDGHDIHQEIGTGLHRSRRLARAKYGNVDASSMATVRELLKEIRRLEQEIDGLVTDNEDLVCRMEDLLEENESLRQHSRSAAPSVARFRATPRSNTHRDDRESFGGARLQEVYDSDGCAPGRKQSSGQASVSSRTHASFGGVDQSISVPTNGAMRPTRSRVSTPYVSDAAVDRLSNLHGSDNESVSRQSVVNFEDSVHVVKVPLDENSEHHIRSIRGRIVTPFINDVHLTAEDEHDEHTDL